MNFVHYDHLTSAELQAVKAFDAWITELRVSRLELLVFGKANFNPNQPRVPAGRPGGGQWTRLPIVSHEAPTDAIEEAYLLETALGLLSASGALLALRTAVRSWSGVGTAVSEDTLKIIKSLEGYFGGAPRVFPNKKGDLILMRGNKKIRFDIKNSHGYDPHFHIEEKINGKWADVGKHHHYFKDR